VLRKLGAYQGILFGLFLAGALYAWYVYTQFEITHDFNQRELGHLARTVESTLDTALTNVRNLESSEDLENLRKESPYLTLVASKPAGCKPGKEGYQPVQKVGNKALVIEASGACTLTFAFDVQKILSEMPFLASFQTVFLAAPDGRVLVQAAGSGANWQDDLGWADRNLSPRAAAGADGFRVENLASIVSNSSGQTLDKLRGSTANTGARVGGDYYHLYLQPLAFPIASNEKETRGFLLGGVLSYPQLLQRAIAFDTYLLAGLLLAVLVVILGWPFLKLWSLDPHERFRLSDVHWLYLSSGALLVLATNLVLAADGYGRYQREARNGLERLAGTLLAKLTQEVRDARAQLLADANLFQQSPPAGRLLPQTGQYRAALQVALIGCDGWQTYKAVASGDAGSNVRVSMRPYFQAPRAGALWSIPSSAASGLVDTPFYLHPGRSITDGVFYSFLSIPLKLDPEEQCNTVSHKPVTAAVMTLDLASLAQQPLPRGYGFALIDRQGDVLYHSDTRLSLRMNLFEELADGDRLRALVLSRRPDHLEVDYRTRPHAFYLRPVDVFVPHKDKLTDPPQWFLAAFRDRSIDRAVAVHTVELSLFWLVVLFLFACLFLASVSHISRRIQQRPGTWLWPYEEKRLIYIRVTVALGGLFLVAIPLIPYPNYLLLVTTLAPFVALVLFTIARPRAGSRSPLQSTGWHTATLLLITIHLAVLPSFALAHFIWRHEFGKLIAAEESRLATAREDIRLGRRAFVEKEFPLARVDAVEEQYKRYVIDRWPPFDGSSKPVSDPSWLSDLHRWVTSQMPVQNATVARLLYLPPYTTPLLEEWPGPAAAISLALLLAILAAWVRFNSRWVFLADADHQAPGTWPEGESWAIRWNQLPAEEKRALLLIYTEGIANPAAREATLSLIRRGYVRFGPELRPVEALREFLATIKPSEAEMSRWDRPTQVGSWAHMRRILVFAVPVLALFLLATQPNLSSKLPGALALLSPLLKKLLDKMNLFGLGDSESKPAASAAGKTETHAADVAGAATKQV
jgi:hypothetical protein